MYAHITGRRASLLPAVSIRLTAASACLSCVLSCFGLPNSLYAQTAPPTAIGVARNVDDFYNRLHSLRASFTETYRDSGSARQESGILLLERPGKMRWSYDSPPGKLFLIDGKDAYFYAPGTGEAQRISAKKLDDMRTPLRFLLGHAHLEKELDSLTVADAQGVTTLRGVPKFQGDGTISAVTGIEFGVLPSGEITRIETTQADGTTTTIVLGSQEQNLPINAGAFQFTAPPGVKVVDGVGAF